MSPNACFFLPALKSKESLLLFIFRGLLDVLFLISWLYLYKIYCAN